MLMIYTGHGKGKTTAALGLVFRALGRGLRVAVVQFIKGKWKTGERLFADSLPQLTFLVMGPTWSRVNNEALRPYLDGQIEQPDALKRAAVPVREFMIGQIIKADNQDDVYMFMEFARQKPPTRWDDVGLTSLVPAFMLSELKTAFFLGFKIYLPFLIIDIVISTVLISMGMMMLPPVMISLPFKLLLFVLVDGWSLITRGLMGTFAVT